MTQPFTTTPFSSLATGTALPGFKVVGFSAANVDQVLAIGAPNGLPYINTLGQLAGCSLISGMIVAGLGFTPANTASPSFTGATITLADAQNIVIGTGTGTKIGTSTSQKIAFFNSTPIVKPSGDLVTALQNLGLIASITIALPGTTTATTAAVGDNTTLVATNAFVTSATAGITAVATTGGSTTLTAAQYGHPIIRVTGVLVSNATLVVPNNGVWVIENATTGAFTLTIKTSAGTGVTVNQGGTGDVCADNTNVVYVGAGAPYKITQVVSAGVSYTTGVLTTLLKIRMLGGGGGGGGTTTAAASAAAGGGGAAGAYAEWWIQVLPNTAYTIAIGAAGTAGSAAGGTGGTGGNTTFQVGAVTVTASGGLGGVGSAAGTAITTSLGGAGVASTNGTINGTGAPGLDGTTFSGLIAAAGSGAANLYYGGGIGKNTAGAGVAGTGFGTGGAGGVVLNNSAAVAGGAGTAGVIFVDEYT